MGMAQASGTVFAEGLPKRLHRTINIYRYIVKEVLEKNMSSGEGLKGVTLRVVSEFADASNLALASEMGGVYLSSAPLINSSIIFLSVISKVVETAGGRSLEEVLQEVDRVGRKVDEALLTLVMRSYHESAKEIVSHAGSGIYLYGSEVLVESIGKAVGGRRGRPHLSIVASSPWESVPVKAALEYGMRVVAYPNFGLDLRVAGSGEEALVVDAESIVIDMVLSLSGARSLTEAAVNEGIEVYVVSTPLSSAIWLPEFIKEMKDVEEVIPRYHIIQEWGEPVPLPAMDPIPVSKIDALFIGSRKLSSKSDFITMATISAEAVKEAIMGLGLD
ncbi:MAG: hypothetical protein F7C09_04155 [Aeropyrum sp.]|nr:hypothetical protein [Aeropyrum sp.]